MGSLLCLEPPRIPPKLWSCTSAFSSTSIHSRINLPVTFSIKLGNCAEGQILTICSRMRQDPLQSPQAGIQSQDTTGVRECQPGNSSGEWRYPLWMEKSEQRIRRRDGIKEGVHKTRERKGTRRFISNKASAWWGDWRRLRSLRDLKGNH